MAVFEITEERMTGSDVNIDLVVPDGRIWKILSIGIALNPDDEPALLEVYSTDDGTSLYGQTFHTTSTSLAASIGAVPTSQPFSPEAGGTGGPVFSLPDVCWPSG